VSRPPFGENPDVDIVRIAAATTLQKRDEIIADLRALVAEMCAHWERIGTTREEDELISQWRQRAGLEPAITGAGTEHLAAELTEDR
jgi:hypothetical protein